MLFLHLRSSVLPDETRRFLLWTFRTPYFKFERNRFKRSQDMRLQKLALFLGFFLIIIFLPLFAHLQKLL